MKYPRFSHLTQIFAILTAGFGIWISTSQGQGKPKSSSYLILESLDSCVLSEGDSQNIRAKVRKGIVAEGGLACDSPTTAQKFAKDLSSIKKNLTEANRPASTDMYDFAQNLWKQSMRNLLITRLDAEMRYQNPIAGKAKKESPLDVKKILSLVCGSDGNGPLDQGIPLCNTASRLGSPVTDWLVNEGKKYVADFKAAEIKPLTLPEARVEINLRLKFLDDLYQPVREIRGETDAKKRDPYGSSSRPAQDQIAVMTAPRYEQIKRDYRIKTGQEQRLQQASAFADPIADQIRGSGTGILLYSSALAPYNRLEGQVKKDSDVSHAILELKDGTALAGRQLNIDIGWALGTDWSGKNTNPKALASSAWIEKMIVTNPIAAGQIMAQTMAQEPQNYKKYAEMMCFFLQSMGKTNLVKERLNSLTHSLMFATMVVGGAAALPDLIALNLTKGAASALATAQAINSMSGSLAFGYSLSSDIIKSLQVSPGEIMLRQSAMQGSGATASDIKRFQESAASVQDQLVYDVLYLVAPVVGGRIISQVNARSLKLKLAEEVIESGPISQIVVDLNKRFAQSRQLDASWHLLSLACGTLNANCGVIMAAFGKLPTTEQRKVLANEKSIAEFMNHSIQSPEKSVAPKERVGKTEQKSTFLVKNQETVFGKDNLHAALSEAEAAAFLNLDHDHQLATLRSLGIKAQAQEISDFQNGKPIKNQVLVIDVTKQISENYLIKEFQQIQKIREDAWLKAAEIAEASGKPMPPAPEPLKIGFKTNYSGGYGAEWVPADNMMIFGPGAVEHYLATGSFTMYGPHELRHILLDANALVDPKWTMQVSSDAPLPINVAYQFGVRNQESYTYAKDAGRDGVKAVRELRENIPKEAILLGQPLLKELSAKMSGIGSALQDVNIARNTAKIFQKADAEIQAWNTKSNSNTYQIQRDIYFEGSTATYKYTVEGKMNYVSFQCEACTKLSTKGIQQFIENGFDKVYPALPKSSLDRELIRDYILYGNDESLNNRISKYAPLGQAKKIAEAYRNSVWQEIQQTIATQSRDMAPFYAGQIKAADEVRRLQKEVADYLKKPLLNAEALNQKLIEYEHAFSSFSRQATQDRNRAR